MKTVAYLRVSTAQQDAGSQRLAILEYPHTTPSPFPPLVGEIRLGTIVMPS